MASQMLFPNLLKGRLAESVLITLLERAGYRVTRIGIEELFNEVKHLELAEYLKLRLPSQLRTIPDLLVAEPEITAAFMVEVKFRRRFDRETSIELHSTLADQRRYWPESYAVLMLGEPVVQDGRFHQDYIRVIPPGQEPDLLKAPTIWPTSPQEDRARWLWDTLPQLQNIFTRFSLAEDNAERGYPNQQRADFITRTLADLARL